MFLIAPHKLQWTRFSLHLEQEEANISGAIIDGYDMQVSFLPDWFHNMMIQWVVPEEWKPHAPKFMVYMSEAQEGPYREMSGTPFDDNKFIAYETAVTTKFRNEFWIVQTILDDGRIFRSTPVTVMQHLPRWQMLRYLDIVRRERILLDKFTGIDTIVFRRREYGERCPKCWDPINEKQIVDNCEQCYNTTYDGGYYPGIKFKVQFDSTTNNLQNTYFGNYEPHQLVGWTVCYPTLNPHDIVIRLSDFRIYRIEALQNTELMTRPLRQIMQLTEIPQISIEYQLLKRRNWVEIAPRKPHVHH